jgi:hypothetical protein
MHLIHRDIAVRNHLAVLEERVPSKSIEVLEAEI